VARKRSPLEDGSEPLDPPATADDEPADLAAIDILTVLQALSDPVRLEIIRQLTLCPDSGELTCGQIEVPVSKSTATHHFKALLKAGITTEREEGTRKFICLRRAELDERFPGLIDAVVRDFVAS
jgi:DNA-binding transcriptional ArsR family regulator